MTEASIGLHMSQEAVSTSVNSDHFFCLWPDLQRADERVEVVRQCPSNQPKTTEHLGNKRVSRQSC